jgi:spermidine synthase
VDVAGIDHSRYGLSVTPPWILFALFFASGLAGLVYELLWARELALVFGNTAQATATTLAVFFLGLSAGQRAAGRRTARARNPLRTYAVLEALVAATASMYFVVGPLYRAGAPGLLAWIGGDGVAVVAVSGALAAGALLAPCFCMGATLPVMGQLVVRRADALAPAFGLLYAVQTVGGALGAFVAGFWLPGVVGFTRTYLIAMAISATVAVLAYLASRTRDAAQSLAPTPGRARPRSQPADRTPRMAAAIACLSGFAALAVEVLWTHMFSQALHNSVYSFAAILVTFLVALSLGGLLAAGLARRSTGSPQVPLVVLLSVSGVAVATSPFVFDWMTGGLQLLAGIGWSGYVRATFGCAAAVMLGPGILLGSVFPYTLRLAQRVERGAGAIIGELAFWNTVGAVAGSLCAGFVLLPWLGLWSSLRVAALLYLLAAAVVAGALVQRGRVLMLLPVAGIVLLLLVLDPTRLPRVFLDPGEVLKSVRDTANGTVAVVEADGVLALELDGHYTVGGTGSITSDRRQAELPMLLHPRPRSVFFVGLGTGVTAGAALFHPVDRVTVAELVPAIAAAARDSFAPFANGLFSDARAHIAIGDARTILRADSHRYDVIVGDLFVPWHAGTGSLYTREHFENIRDRLGDDGVFAQWLPLYQLSWREFAVIAHTMLEVFPQVTVWRGDFSARMPIAALIGQRTPRPLDLDAVVANVRRRQGGEGYSAARAHALALLFYAGNLSAARDLVASAPINTDDRPVIEYLAPATPLDVVAGQAEWLTGSALSRLWRQLAERVPPDEDPYLTLLSADERSDVDAGRLLQEVSVLHDAGQPVAAQAAFDEFARRVPAEVAAAFAPPTAPR